MKHTTTTPSPKPATHAVNPLAQNAEVEVTAQPKEIAHMDEGTHLDDMTNTGFEYDKMNLQDAKTSGYTDKKGHAVSMAKKDVDASPTGAYTDIGAGRSSVVRSSFKDEDKSKH